MRKMSLMNMRCVEKNPFPLSCWKLLFLLNIVSFLECALPKDTAKKAPKIIKMWSYFKFLTWLQASPDCWMCRRKPAKKDLQCAKAELEKIGTRQKIATGWIHSKTPLYTCLNFQKKSAKLSKTSSINTKNPLLSVVYVYQKITWQGVGYPAGCIT